MGRITSLAGLIAVLVLAWNAQAVSPSEWRPKRSIYLPTFQSGTWQLRIPVVVVPTHYDVALIPNIDAGTFEGRVQIDVLWTEKSDSIMFHAGPDLLVKKCSVDLVETKADTKNQLRGWERPTSEATLDIARVEKPRSKFRPWHTIELAQMIPKGSMGSVEIHFSGILNTNDSSGFFMSEYIDSTRTRHQFAGIANLRLHNARNVFPCMDQPAWKATFRTCILRTKNVEVIANTPEVYRDREIKLRNVSSEAWHIFGVTPMMSTFQFSLLISDFKTIVMVLQDMELRLWGREEYLEEISPGWPNKVARIYQHLQKYFGSSFGLPKLDIVALPNYIAAKPSDSWGLMFFKESEIRSPLFWNIVYEMMYQWIGQYITPSNWPAAPVSKALNSFLASMATIEINPNEMEGKWPMTMLYSMYYEYGKAVPFSFAVGFENEAVSAKTELIFRMFNYTLGRDLFREGVRKFLNQTDETGKVRSFYEGDIYLRLNEVANGTGILPDGVSINTIAMSWIYRNRIPVVRMEQFGEPGTIALTFQPYLREPSGMPSRLQQQWIIPIVMITQENLDFSNTRPTTWLTQNNRIIGIGEGSTSHWLIDDPRKSQDSFVIINPEEIGMFLVNYDDANWQRLSMFLQGPDRECIPVLTRAKLLHDSWNLAYAGIQNFSIALDMTLFLKQERSHVVWQPIFTMIDHISKRIESSCSVSAKFQAYIFSLVKPLFDELGETAQPPEPYWKVHLRGLAKNFLCRAGYRPCIDEAMTQFSKWVHDDEPDKGNPVANEFLCPVFKWGTEKEFEFGLHRVINFPRNSPERKQSERTYLLKTLTSCVKHRGTVEMLLDVAILQNKGNFTDSDIRLIFSMLTSNMVGYTTLFDFLAEHFYEMKTKFETKYHLWNGMVNAATSSFHTDEGLNMVTEFYELHKGEFGSAESIIQESLKSIAQKTEWRNMNLPEIEKWLDENLPAETLEKLKASETSQ